MKAYSWLLTLALPFALTSAAPNAATGPLCREGETNLLSFTTKNGKSVSLCVGAANKYLVYRYGTTSQTELQYPPALDASSWEKFAATNYQKPSMGKANSAEDLHRLVFKNGNVTYTIYDDTSDANGHVCGVGVTMPGKKEVFMQGNLKSVTGQLADLSNYHH
jgi:hypothetical protein